MIVKSVDNSLFEVDVAVQRPMIFIKLWPLHKRFPLPSPKHHAFLSSEFEDSSTKEAAYVPSELLPHQYALYLNVLVKEGCIDFQI